MDGRWSVDGYALLLQSSKAMINAAQNYAIYLMAITKPALIKKNTSFKTILTNKGVY